MIVTRHKTREASKLSHLYTEDDAGGPYTVTFDVWFTRRKRFHCIEDRNGAVVFRSRWVPDIIDWLAQRGAKGYTALGGSEPWLVTMRKPSGKKEPKA